MHYFFQDRVSLKKSITVISEGQKIDLNFFTKRVLVDGKKVETPFQVRLNAGRLQLSPVVIVAC